MFCHHCGHRNPIGVNFCSSCGTAVVTSAPDTSVSVPPVAGGSWEAQPPSTLEVPRGVGILIVPTSSGESIRIALEGPTLTVGRHPDSGLFLDDITVSRRHAEFASGDDGVEVRDVGSLNGTYVNRARIESARLTSGDEVQIGKFKLVYVRGAGE